MRACPGWPPTFAVGPYRLAAQRSAVTSDCATRASHRPPIFPTRCSDVLARCAEGRVLGSGGNGTGLGVTPRIFVAQLGGEPGQRRLPRDIGYRHRPAPYPQPSGRSTGSLPAVGAGGGRQGTAYVAVRAVS